MTDKRTLSHSQKGKVVSPHYLATQAGESILSQGGTAIDAIIGTSAVLSVIYPHMCGIGGDNFWLVYSSAEGSLQGLHADGVASSNAHAEYFLKKGYTQIPFRGYDAAITVPGAVSGWSEAFKYSKEVMKSPLSWEQLLQPAINYAENGFPVSHSLADWLCANTRIKHCDLPKGKVEQDNLERYSEFAKMFLKNGDSLYQEGDIASFPDLANSLHAIAKDGADAFYRGSIAEAISADMKKNEGLLCLQDFNEHMAQWVEPLSVPYREFVAYNLPPATQGMTSLAILNILNQFDIRSLEEGTADYYHLLVEAIKEAFSDRDTWIADPAHKEIPIASLLSSVHAKKQASRISSTVASNAIKPLTPGGDTVWLGAVDRHNNAVSMIQSIYHDFGSGIVPKGTGILLQNRGCCFSLDPNHNNSLVPGKHTFHTLNPAMLFKNNVPYLVYGTMGGEGQPQTQAAIVTRIVDFGMEPHAAISAPRWLYGRTWGDDNNALKLEGRIPTHVAELLKKRGHPVMHVDDYTDMMGHAGAILIENGTIKSASDPRSNGIPPETH